MDRSPKGDMEHGMPTASSGPDGQKSKQKSKMATTGGGGDMKRKAPASPPPNNTKKIVLASGVLLCIVSLVAIVMVTSGNYGSSYNMSIPQFQGDLQMEELDGEMVTWSDDYNDPNSEKSQALKKTLSSRMRSAFHDEGVEVDEVNILGFTAAEPKTVVTTKLKSTAQAGGRSVFSSMGDSDQFQSAEGALTPNDITSMEVETVEHADVSYVNMKFETKGTPTKNAAVFTSSNGQWTSVSNMVESRMASEGVGVSIQEIKPEPQFMDSVYKAIEDKPSLMQTPPMQTPQGEPCPCQDTGYDISPKTKVCLCDSSCVQPQTYIYGGTDNIFAVYSNLCLAAYYAGITTDEGGLVEVIDLNEGKVTSAGVKNGVTAWNIPFDVRIFKVKSFGPVINPAQPPPSPGSTNQFSGAIITGEVMFTMYLQYLTVGGQPVSFVPSMTNVKSSEAKQLTDMVLSKIQSAVSAHGFVVGGVVPSEIIHPPTKAGVIIGVEIKGDFATNVENAVRLESMEAGSVPSKILQSMSGDDVRIRVFRYSKAFLEKMTRSMEKAGASQNAY
ncbi:uncharacterized protein LOC120342650 [Styela clava]